MMLMKTLSVGSETALSRIVSLVEDALTKKTPIQSLVDRISGVFVPIVIGLSLITLVLWLALGYSLPDIVPDDSSEIGFALTFSISVLVIACPCALGIMFAYLISRACYPYCYNGGYWSCFSARYSCQGRCSLSTSIQNNLYFSILTF